MYTANTNLMHAQYQQVLNGTKAVGRDARVSAQCPTLADALHLSLNHHVIAAVLVLCALY